MEPTQFGSAEKHHDHVTTTVKGQHLAARTEVYVLRCPLLAPERINKWSILVFRAVKDHEVDDTISVHLRVPFTSRGCFCITEL